MPPKKETNLTRPQSAAAADAAVVEQLDDNVIAIIFSCLGPVGIMRMRRVCKKWRDAAKKAIVDHFCVDSIVNYNAMRAMTTALPNLQQLSICSLGKGHKYIDGEDPNERRAAQTANYTTHDINIISNFRKLRCLDLGRTRLNGRYPFLFNFPLLQQLKINCYYLKFDLDMLAGLPLLEELYCHDNQFLTGNINSLRVLKDTLEKVTISFSPRVQGNFMDLADFPRLRTLTLRETSVTGDIRNIGEGDFPSLKSLTLPKGVYGGTGYEFQHISDGPDIAMAVNSIKKQRPSLLIESWHASLSEDSPDWYGLDDEFDEYYGDDRGAFPSPPLHVRLVTAGSRVGYQWESADGEHPCEVNWLDPEPHRESSDYEKYIRELRVIERQVRFFRGFQQPPSRDAFNVRLRNFVENM
mmetsp:Transcript_2349/g.3520  ORF Transcript_2349/g.3520 Transcript_2349/m.3520 type:complete len:411 (+) Transcript_2349:187-1419(+)